jgi:hypothetical protein
MNLEWDEWRAVVDQFAAEGFWNASEWGPSPDDAGCLAPPDILAERGYGKINGHDGANGSNGDAGQDGPLYGEHGPNAEFYESIEIDLDRVDNNALDRLIQEKERSSGKKGRKRKVRRPQTDDERAADKADLDEMNAKYAVVKIGGKTRVMGWEESEVFPGCEVPVFSSVPGFCEFHHKRKKKLPDSTKKVGLGRWWINHDDRRQFDGVVYSPGGAPSDDVFNLWTGFACKPKKGDCGLYLAHLRNNICSGDDVHYNYLLDWKARAVQKPDLQGEVAIVLRGNEGTGKGVAVKQFGLLFGPHFLHVTQASHLTGHFNAHLQRVSVVFPDEAFFAGDRTGEGILKALVTEEILMIESKGLDPYPARNRLHMILSSNNDWVVPAGADARRYFVLSVSDAKKQDHEYFAAIIREMDNGGREALLHLLMRRDISGFNVRVVPQTAALADQKAHTRRGIDRLIEQIAHEGVLPAVHSSSPNVAVTTGEAKNEGFYFQARALVPDLKFLSSIVIALKLKEWGCEPWHVGNQRGIEFPSLVDLRKKFDARHGKQEWPTSDDTEGEPKWDF